MNIYFANDHAGYELKLKLIDELKNEFNCIDLGSSKDRVDYPDYGAKLAAALKDDANAIGVAICGSGLGISMAANRFSHIRAALCHCEEYAKLAKEHNNANVICFGARFITPEHAISMLRVFLGSHCKGERHLDRVKKLSELGC